MRSREKTSGAITITGMGMVSSLGHDVVTSCAAARAGIVRSADLEWFPVLSPLDGAIESAIGYPVPILTEGFEGEARLLRLTQAGLSDLKRRVSDVPWTQAHTAFYLSMPDPRRLRSGINLIADENDRQAFTEEANKIVQEASAEDVALRLLENAARLNGWPGELTLRFVTTSGHTGVAEALRKAYADLTEGRVEAAVVGGVDSLLEENTLAWLENTGRLKTPDLPTGLQTGEACAFLLLEIGRSAKARGAVPCAILKEISLAKECRTLLSGEPPLGMGLVEVISSITKRFEWENARPVWLISDQNGESYRAIEWGNAIVRLVAQSQAFVESELWCPAASFGDTGAASGAVSICTAIRAFVRGYAPAQTVAVISSADGFARSAILLRAHSN